MAVGGSFDYSVSPGPYFWLWNFNFEFDLDWSIDLDLDLDLTWTWLGPDLDLTWTWSLTILNGSCRMHVYVLQNIVRTWSSEKGNSMNLLIPQNHTLPGRIYILFPKFVLQEKKILYIDPWLSSLNENWVKPVAQNHEDNKSLKERILSSLELFSLMRLDSIAI